MDDWPGRSYLVSDLIETLTEETAALLIEERTFHQEIARALSEQARDAR